ncbi:hypothetical protein GCM10027176_78420 [Actinoallomurus bryophytorum]|uniref:Uncharacterized protein n=1 Tax=Actinoallomurus bryophytorum TaxID=1490222 RepID=A0A543CFN9_9ACTN|nr:hypothetical protein [Actinoallomurus bryophytorum]TQL95919.1 hypothetical protein FB559_1431 [Actinoallomurus bryophytorum]
MSRTTRADVLVLHAARTLGYATAARIAGRTGLPEAETAEHLLDAQARGWVARSSFAGDGGWSLTEAGKQQGERLLATELDAAGARLAVEDIYQDFLPLNDVVGAACTAWQLAEMGIGEQPVTLTATITTLEAPAHALAALEARLTTHLARFAGYHQLFAVALNQASTEPAWITGTDRDSCHRVWFELHEDLIATLNLTR